MMAYIKTDEKPELSSSNNLEYNWKEIRILSCQYPKQAGMTIFTYYNPDNLTKRMSYYLSKRGKDIGGFGTDIINRTPTKEIPFNGVHSVVLVGGSTLGLEAISGVQEVLLKDNLYWYNKILDDEGRKKHQFTPLHERVMGACCFTTNLSINKSYLYPDLSLGKFGMKNLLNQVRKEPTKTQTIYLKQNGVGVNSTVAKLNSPDADDDNSWTKNTLPAGVGAKFIEIDDLKILVFINLNSLGVIHDNYQLLHNFPINKENKGTKITDDEKIMDFLNDVNENYLFGINKKISNTTLSVIITNMEIPEDKKEEISEKLHDEIESMIYPYGTVGDGDILFLLSTWDVEFNEKKLIDNTKPLIRESIKSVFEEEMTGGGINYYNKYLKYKNKYLKIKDC